MKGLGFYICVAVVAVTAAFAYEPEWYITTVDDDGPVGMMCNIALDGDDRPHVVYWNRGGLAESRSLRYAYYDGNDWDITDVEAGNAGQYGDIAIDASGHPHVSYNKCFDWITCRGQLKYARFDGARWHVEVVDDSGYAGLHTSIALDSGGRPHIAHREHLSGLTGNLKYSYYDGSSWHTTIIDDGVDPGYCTSIAIDSRDNPHISYRYEDNYNHDTRVKYAYYDGSSWHVETVDTSGTGTSIALDYSDRPHISYTVSDTKDLKYAYKDGGRWHITTVDAEGHLGHRTGIALGGDGEVHISYHEYVPGGRAVLGHLKYAFYDGANWRTTYVEKGADNFLVGPYNSLALDSFGVPHIAYEFYVHHADEYLKYACLVGDYLNYFTAAPRGYDGLVLTWSVKSPLGEQIEAFNLYRREKGEGEWRKVNEVLLPGGGSGSYDDGGLACLRSYEYLLEGIVEGRPRQLGLTEGTTGVPQAFFLHNARPNPSSNSAVIAFELMDRADVELTVFDIAGRKVATLAAGWLPPGAHEREVSALAPGVYVYLLQAGDWAGAKKMVVVR
ncbi:MAG: hypothetical protein V3W11_10990 [bacterium]